MANEDHRSMSPLSTRTHEPIRHALSLHIWPLAYQMHSFFTCLATRLLLSIMFILFNFHHSIYFMVDIIAKLQLKGDCKFRYKVENLLCCAAEIS